MEILLEAGFPAGPLYNYKEVFEDPHTLAREMMVEMNHPVEGTVKGLGIPVKLSETPGGIRRPAPLLGEHTEETLMGLGYSKEEIAKLRERRII
jgi:formyl-CoA transferase